MKHNQAVVQAVLMLVPYNLEFSMVSELPVDEKNAMWNSYKLQQENHSGQALEQGQSACSRK